MIIEVKDLEVKYKNITAVDKISFTVQEGEIFGIIGPNGAGKTTTIECIEGLRESYNGTINILGLDPKNARKKLYELIGVQLQETSYPDKIKVWEICKLFSSFYAKVMPYEKLLKDFSLYEKKNEYVSKLSGGQRQKLSIILSLLPSPKIVFLDELTTGLDPQARKSMWELIKNLKTQGITVFMTTHFMEEAEYLCDRIAIMNNGKIAALDNVSNLLNQFELDEKIIFSANNIDIVEIANVQGVSSVKNDGDTFTLYGRDKNFLGNIVNYLQKCDIEYSNISVTKPNLEDVFFKVTGTKVKNMEGME